MLLTWCDVVLGLEQWPEVLDDLVVTWLVFGVVKVLQRIVDQRDDEIRDDDECREAKQEHDDSAENTGCLACFLVVHVHVTYRQSHYRRVDGAEVVHLCAKPAVTQRRERHDKRQTEDAKRGQATLGVVDGAGQHSDGSIVAQNVQKTKRDQERGEWHQNLVNQVGVCQFLETDGFIWKWEKKFL